MVRNFLLLALYKWKTKHGHKQCWVLTQYWVQGNDPLIYKWHLGLIFLDNGFFINPASIFTKDTHSQTTSSDEVHLALLPLLLRWGMVDDLWLMLYTKSYFFSSQSYKLVSCTMLNHETLLDCLDFDVELARLYRGDTTAHVSPETLLDCLDLFLPTTSALHSSCACNCLFSNYCV